ncbi:MAG: hypothetical protein B7Y88_15490 [Sphingomonadales bacterium 32-64-17]|nr:MAG: hypothetical protein B7Y88_15490 [Sphingomonadales bacterium 32-64-17]
MRLTVRPILAVAGASLAVQAAAPAFAETINATINVGTNERNGVCYIHLPRDDGMELEISVRAEDANMNVTVANIPAEWVEEGEGQDVPISITPNKGKPFASDHGEYVAEGREDLHGGIRWPQSGRVRNPADIRHHVQGLCL